MKRRVKYIFNSLLGEVLLWILTLLMFLWGLSVVMTYQVADSIADQPYDEQLANKVRALGGLLRRHGNTIVAPIPPAARDVLLTDAKDRVYYEVSRLNGEFIAGDHDIPWEEMPRKSEQGDIGYYDAEFNGEDIRVAFEVITRPGMADPILVQVAETRKKRLGLVAGIVSGVIVPQFVMVPLAVLLVYLGFTRGITPLQRLQEELRQRRPIDLSPISVQGIPEEVRPLIDALNDVMARLQHSLGGQRRFIADASHQLKTPLTGLRTQTELALRETSPQAMRESLQCVAAAAESLSRLTHQLLSLARAEAAADTGSVLAWLDLDQLAHGVATEWADRALAKGVDLGYESAGREVPISANALLLHEALTNLIENAVKYTPRGGRVTVRSRCGERSCIEVEDTGIGIPAAERARVFERFYRVLGTEVDGSGLGLAIVKEIVELFGGCVEIEDGPGARGTLVRLSFPKAAVEPDKATLVSVE